MTASLFRNYEKSKLLDSTRIPNHIAIIPDGNRRWAQNKKVFIHKGHNAGARVLIEIVKAAKELGVKTVTFYIFSTENWNRSKKEVAQWMWLLQRFLKDNCSVMQSQGVKLRAIGNLEKLSKSVLKILEQTIFETSHCNKIDMVLAINYGGRDEILRALKCMIEDCGLQKMGKNDVDETFISRYLDTAPWADPDLLIRTSGEKRISNFLLWQLSYTEIYFTDILWPDFTPDDLLDAVADFQLRKRRWGGT